MAKYIIPVIGFFSLLSLISVYKNISDSQMDIVTAAWVIVLIFSAMMTVVIILIGGAAYIRSQMLKASKEGLIHPDENGNYPIRLSNKYQISLWPPRFVKETVPVNLNLTGADENIQAYTVHQVTNNRGGSVPREVINRMGQPQQPQTKLIGPPPQVTAQMQANEIPPVIIDARKQAEHI